ncbi:MAG: hypothetical protein A49_23820 [Methyloceanibacter sp.]|nr:MAG: hypothetical protein A49_23820 [Methyloceanibacter sp.]
MVRKTDYTFSLRRARNIPRHTSLFLYTQAGGRCEFDGCNKYLLEHYPTEALGNFAEQAHIYAFSESGPRGMELARPDDINSLSNLILLCPACHHLVDSNPRDFPVSVLKRFKRDHEERIFDLTGLSKDRGTVPLVLRGLVAGRTVDISDEQMQVAVVPNHLKRRDKIEIDLTAIPDSARESFWQTATATIDRQVGKLYSIPVRPGRALHVSVFAIAPIPLLVYLGSRLSDKLEVELYQRHRNPESWEWQSEPGRSAYVTTRLREGSDPQCVALLLNLSGTNESEALSPHVDARFSVYEITLKGCEANQLFLARRSDLSRFHDEYIRCISMIRRVHAGLKVLHLFPAVPAPVAVLIGRSRLPKVDPALLVYDRDKRAGGLVPTLEITAT